jgi:hypothetical protein
MSAVAAERTVIPLSSIRELRPGSFVFERANALPPSFCDEVIARFEANPEQHTRGASVNCANKTPPSSRPRIWW